MSKQEKNSAAGAYDGLSIRLLRLFVVRRCDVHFVISGKGLK
ncbi:hypothetical protein [Ruminococcus albus]|nr:hypothetical protein [Ruminococcus albus]